MISPTRLQHRHRWGAALLLGGIGFALNLRPVPLSPGTDILFGGVAYLLAAVALGPLHGALSAAIASIGTLWLWEHPFAWMIFILEAAAVGYLARRRGLRPLGAELVYWVVVGVPLLFLTYYLVLGVRGTDAAVVFLKQPFNGLIDAVLVESLFLLPPVRRALRLRGAPDLRSALAAVVTLAAVTPALGFGVWVGRQEWERNLDRARERVSLFAESYASKLEQYVRLHEGAVRSVAQAAEERGEFDPAHLQRLLTAQHREFSGFIDMYAANANAVTVAFHPLRLPDGTPLIGLDFSDRAYFRRLRETRRTVVTEVFAGRGGADEPLVAIAHPIVIADTLAGFVLGALDLKRLPRPVPSPPAEERLRVADPRGTIVYDSELAYAAGSPPRDVEDSLAFAAVRATGPSGTTEYASPRPGLQPAFSAPRILAGVAYLPSLDWWVWVEEPFSEIQGFVGETYVRLLAMLIGVTLLALGVSDLLARYLSLPLLRLRTAAGALASGDLGARVGRIPPGMPVELEELARGFDDMASSLAARTEELEELGEIARSLASTLDADELLRQVTDAALRLVRPDGCGIALLGRGGRSLRTTPYSLGLLAPAAGREISVEGSLMGWVVLEGTPLRIEASGGDDRLRRAFVDVARVGSVICAPLMGRSGPLGTLTAVRARSNPVPFTDTDLELLQRLARHGAIAVENARLVASERRRASESEAIRVVARTVSATQGLDDTLAVVAREAARIVRAEACTVALLQEDGEELEVVAASGTPHNPIGAVVSVAGELMQGALKYGEAIMELDGRHTASVSLEVGAETLGVLTAARGDEPFGPTDIGLLAALADHAAVALRNARLLEAAQAASRAKSDFIATMSHELRTPLNAVLGHLQLLEMEIHGPLQPAQRESLSRIGAASRHLRGLIEEVLSFARLEAGRVEVRITDTDLCALAEEVAAVIQPLASEKGLSFSIEPCERPAVVPTDPDKVRQILINLAGNAVKFTEMGEVRIRVGRRPQQVILTVRDSGPGISAEDMDRLFRPFEQLESGFSREHGGTGLGLYLSGQYSELVGGRIEVASELGRGSEFTLVLPEAGPFVDEESESGDDREGRPRPSPRESGAPAEDVRSTD